MEDMISRQALCEYALNQKNKSVTPNDIMRFPSAQPEPPTDDCISRKAAIAEIARWIGYIDEDMIGRIQIGLNRLPSAQPNLQPTCNLASNDCISRQAAIDAVYKCADIFVGDMPVMVVKADAYEALAQLPSAQPTEASCWGCNCQKMERLNEQKTFSEMVHLHDAETHEERTETHSCDCISRQAAIECDGFREVERDDERRSN